MNNAAATSGGDIIRASAANSRLSESLKQETPLRQAFQDFVAGTFYQQMLKSLRKSHGKPAYFHGGRAEEIFRSQLDQEVADSLARDHGGSFSDPLFSVFAQKVRVSQPESPSRAGEVGRTADTRGRK